MARKPPAPNNAWALPGDEVQVWSVPLDGCGSSWRELESALSPEERVRAARFVREPPRRRFVVAHAALRSILGRCLAIEPGQVMIDGDPRGKPQLAGHAGATDLNFNLAHSGELALVAVTRGSAIGVDVEALRPVGHLEEIAARYFSPTEAAAILHCAEPERTARFLATWTAKEAILKALGMGLALRLDAFSVSPDTAGQWVTLDAPPPAVAKRWWLERVVVTPDYFAAVATAEQKRLSPTIHYGEATPGG